MMNKPERKGIDVATIENEAMNKRERKAKNKTLKPISKKHPEFELAYDMMLGIRTVVGKVEAKQSVLMSKYSMQNKKVQRFGNLSRRFQNDFVGLMTPEQFGEFGNYRFPNRGSNCTPPHYMKSFKFKDYCPLVFKMLRQMFDIDPIDYQVELCGNFQYLEFISNSKSGQFFFYSHDQKYMVKTMTKTESKLLRKILPQYYGYIRKHPNSLLTKYFGMHRVKPHRRKKIYFLIMASVFYSNDGLEIHEQYDLKGSTKGRRSFKKETMKKDLDLIKSGTIIHIGREKAKMFKNQIQMDTDFLRKHRIMDYSLLLGIHYRDRDSTIWGAKGKKNIRRHSEGFRTLKPLKRSLSRRPTVQSMSEELPINTITDPEHISSPRKRRKPIPVQWKQKEHYKFTNPLTRKFLIPEIINQDEFRSTPSSPKQGKVSDGALTNPFTNISGGMCYQDPDDGKLGNAIYFVGVIDLLQQFDRRKKLEYFVKSRVDSSEAISSIHPNLYSRRFNRFLSKIII